MIVRGVCLSNGISLLLYIWIIELLLYILLVPWMNVIIRVNKMEELNSKQSIINVRVTEELVLSVTMPSLYN